MYSILMALSSREEPVIRILAFGLIFFYSFFIFWIGVESQEIIKGSNLCEEEEDHQKANNTESDGAVNQPIILFNFQKCCGCQIQPEDNSYRGVGSEET